jgi:hypothetical protein
LASAAVFACALAGAAAAVPVSAADQQDLKRAYAAAAPSASEEPTVRAERALRDPSPGFMLGAALGAWSAAHDQLDFDLKNPSAAGPPHATQGAPDLDAFDQDCHDELTAFQHLETRGQGLDPAAVTTAASAPPALAKAWTNRRASGPASVCRR